MSNEQGWWLILAIFSVLWIAAILYEIFADRD